MVKQTPPSCLIYLQKGLSVYQVQPENSLFKLTTRGSFSQSCVESSFKNRKKPTSGVLNKNTDISIKY